MPIVTDGQLNLAALQIDDVYVVIIPPQTPLIPGFPTDGIGLVGSAIRGPMNSPQVFGDPQSALRAFGDITTHPNDLVTESIGALKQGANNLFGVRVSDGTHATATDSGNDGTNITSGGQLLLFSAATPGTWANAAGANANSQGGVNVIIDVGSAAPPAGVGTPAAGTVTINHVGGAWTATSTVIITIGGTAATYSVTAGDLAAGVASSAAVDNAIAASIASAINAGTGQFAVIRFLVIATVAAGVITLTHRTKGTQGNTTTLSATSTAPAGNTVVVTFGGGLVAVGQTYKVIIASPYDPTEVFDNIAGTAGASTTVGSVTANIINAINNGITGIRGPSAIVTAAGVGSSTGLPICQIMQIGNAIGSRGSTAGADGRGAVAAPGTTPVIGVPSWTNTITTAMLIGVDGLTRTGMYALRGLKIFQFGLSGLTDPSSWSLQVAFAISENVVVVLAQPQGVSSQTAVTNKVTNAIDDYHALMVKDFLFLNDTFNKFIRLVSSIGPVLGKIATLSPERSPGNKAITGYLGTERTGYVAAGGAFKVGIPYSNGEISLLEQNGILFMTVPAVGGNYLALRHGQNTSTDPTRNGTNYSRMTLFIARSLNDSMGFAVNEVHTPALRRRVISALSQYLGSLQDPGPGRGPMIGNVAGGSAFSIVCDSTNNPPNTVAQGYMFVAVQVQYLSIVRFFIIQVEAGQSVSVRVQNNAILRPVQAAA